MTKLNCWEFKNCGREANGLLVGVLGECPASTAMKFDGLNGGKAAGRACWMVENACGRDPRQPSGQRSQCCECDFYKRVLFEQDEATCFRFASEPTQ